jgi:hypothetical protein
MIAVGSESIHRLFEGHFDFKANSVEPDDFDRL